MWSLVHFITDKFPGTKIVNLLKQVLDGMLEVFRVKYSGITNAPKSLTDLSPWTNMVRTEMATGQQIFTYKSLHLHFTDYKEAKEFTRLSLPAEVGRFISLNTMTLFN